MLLGLSRGGERRRKRRDLAALSLITRADLRLRWRSWVVLGLLFGVTFGVAIAGLAGARRTEDALPRYLAASFKPDAAVLPNDPAFDAATRDAVASLPDVRAAYPFMVPFRSSVLQPSGVEPALLPTTRAGSRAMTDLLVAGRLPDQSRSDEIVVNESLERSAGLHIGSTMTVGQSISAERSFRLSAGHRPGRRRDTSARACASSGSQSRSTTRPTGSRRVGSSREFGNRLVGVVNMFVVLRHGEADFTHFQSEVDASRGPPGQHRAWLRAAGAPEDRKHHQRRTRRPAALRPRGHPGRRRPRGPGPGAAVTAGAADLADVAGDGRRSCARRPARWCCPTR